MEMVKYYVNDVEVDKDTYDRAVEKIKFKELFNEVFNVFGYSMESDLSVKKELVEDSDRAYEVSYNVDDNTEDSNCTNDEFDNDADCDDDCPLVEMMYNRITELQEKVEELKESNRQLLELLEQAGENKVMFEELKAKLDRIDQRVPRVIYLPVYSHPDSYKPNW